ncbi:MAG: class I SAM-dependent methyltransferase [Pseudomonadota bacterium]
MAQVLTSARKPHHITYVDLSPEARRVAEARIAARGLQNVTFHTGSLLEAADLGTFDYIDCCGVLHHLPDPQAGFDALARVLSPDGGLGVMVYAPYGRTGVYPLQEAFETLFAKDTPAARVAAARAALETLPDTNWFLRNAQLSDHQASDAGLFDLLLHARDAPFWIEDLDAALTAAGLQMISPIEPARYDPARCLPATPDTAARLKALSPPARMGLAERLSGDLRMHIVYAAPAARAKSAMAKPEPKAVPRLSGLPAAALAKTVAKQGGVDITYAGVKHRIEIPGKAGALIGQIGGRALGEIATAARMDWFAFMQLWGPVHRGLTGYNRLHYTRIR